MFCFLLHINLQNFIQKIQNLWLQWVQRQREQARQRQMASAEDLERMIHRWFMARFDTPGTLSWRGVLVFLSALPGKDETSEKPHEVWLKSMSNFSLNRGKPRQTEANRGTGKTYQPDSMWHLEECLLELQNQERRLEGTWANGYRVVSTALMWGSALLL